LLNDKFREPKKSERVAFFSFVYIVLIFSLQRGAIALGEIVDSLIQIFLSLPFLSTANSIDLYMAQGSVY